MLIINYANVIIYLNVATHVLSTSNFCLWKFVRHFLNVCKRLNQAYCCFGDIQELSCTRHDFMTCSFDDEDDYDDDEDGDDDD